MTIKDSKGYTLTGATSASIDTYEAALAAFHTFTGNPLALVDAAIAAAPDFCMAHLLRAEMLLSGMEAAPLGLARESLEAAAGLIGTERERGHAAVVAAITRGEFQQAAQKADTLLLDYPRDSLALQTGHGLDFFRGDSRNLRDRVLRVLPAWSEEIPGYHAVLGMLAFGLEETGAYAEAEEAGRRACAMQPRDAWAHHAVAHVMEMQGRVEAGIQWMRERESAWSHDNMLSIHNWWHLALLHLERDETDAVLALYDARIRADKSPVALNMIDASAMLWRLHLRGVDAGQGRWNELAEAWSASADDGFYAFNDVHAVIAYLGAGRQDLLDRQMKSLRRAAASLPSADNAAMAADVGVPVAEAMIALMNGRPGRCVDLLRPVRGIANRFGGSHAQRDLIDLTLIEAARRSGQDALVRALAAERLHFKPHSPLAQRYWLSAPAAAA